MREVLRKWSSTAKVSGGVEEAVEGGVEKVVIDS